MSGPAIVPARLQVEDLAGLWTRSLLIDIDGSTDTETVVNWLQGPAAFVDLRQPADRPDFSGVSCAQEFTAEQVKWLAGQGGFAGLLVAGGEFFEWRRALDLQLPHATPDAGTLSFDDEVLVEKGWYESYVEHWRLQPSTVGPVGALHLRAEDKSTALLVRVGTQFGWARFCPQLPGPRGVEIALGSVGERRPNARSAKVAGTRARSHRAWTIDRSSLPYREGSDLGVRLSESVLRTRDIEADGCLIEMAWTITAHEGQPVL